MNLVKYLIRFLFSNVLLFKLIKKFLILTELSVGMNTEGIEVRSVGNTITLHETALIEAFNLKAAIEYQLKNCKYCYKLFILLFCHKIISS